MDGHWVEDTWHGFERHILHPSGDGARALATCVVLTLFGMFLMHLLREGCTKKKKRPHRPYNPPQKKDESLHQA